MSDQCELSYFIVRRFHICRKKPDIFFELEIVMSRIAQLVVTLHGLEHFLAPLVRHKPDNVKVDLANFTKYCKVGGNISFNLQFSVVTLFSPIENCVLTGCGLHKYDACTLLAYAVDLRSDVSVAACAERDTNCIFAKVNIFLSLFSLFAAANALKTYSVI